MLNLIKLTEMELKKLEIRLETKKHDFEAIKQYGIEENRSLLVKILTEIDDLEKKIASMKYDVARYKQFI